MTVEGIEMGGLLCAYATRHDPGRGMETSSVSGGQKKTESVGSSSSSRLLVRRALARKARSSVGR